MAKKDTNIEFEEIDGSGAKDIETSSIDTLQNTFEKNKNIIFGGLALVILLIVGGYYYKNIYMPQAEMSANEEMFEAEYYFEQDSFALALNSSGGFLDIIDNHSGTKAANLAKYYAGLCYYNLANFPEAIDYLSDFSTDDEILGSLALKVLADAQMENGDTESALKTYKKAANFSNNEASTPSILKVAGLAFETNQNYEQALEFYTKIKKEFPSSDVARDIDKYIGRAQAHL